MKVLVTGSTGQLGRELARTCPADIQLIGLTGVDIADDNALRTAFHEIAPDVVINAAAFTAVDAAEQHRERAFAVNAGGAGNVAHACAEHGAALVHISTDFVFDGAQSTPYTPDAICHPLGVYGASKLEGERHVREILGDRALVVRTSWLYSAWGNNFVKTILRLLAERDQIGVVADQVGTPTWARDLAAALWRALRIRLTGLHHWSDAGAASWYDFAVAIAEDATSNGLLATSCAIKPIRTQDYPTPARRPPYSVLDKTATWAGLDVVARHWRVALRDMLAELSEQRT